MVKYGTIRLASQLEIKSLRRILLDEPGVRQLAEIIQEGEMDHVKPWRLHLEPRLVQLLQLGHQGHKARRGHRALLHAANSCHLPLLAAQQQRGKQASRSLHQGLAGVEKLGQLHVVAQLQAAQRSEPNQLQLVLSVPEGSDMVLDLKHRTKKA